MLKLILCYVFFKTSSRGKKKHQSNSNVRGIAMLRKKNSMGKKEKERKKEQKSIELIGNHEC